MPMMRKGHHPGGVTNYQRKRASQDEESKAEERKSGFDEDGKPEMDLLDADGDGKTTFAEAKTVLRGLDDDGDGKISWGEYLAARKNGKLTSDDNAHEMYLARMSKIKEILIYAVFMVFFSMQSCRDLNNANVFHFGNNLAGQFTEVEFLPEHSPVFNKDFMDIGTVEEFFHFLYGPVSHTVYSPNTFDGDTSFTFEGGERKGSTLGYGKLLGGVRISQLRSKAFDCNFHVNGALTENWNFTCYGKNSWFDFGDFSLATELTENFGNYSSPNPDAMAKSTEYAYDGMNAWTSEPLANDTVAHGRGKYMSNFETNKFNIYPAPAYSLVLPPSITLDQAREVVTEIFNSRYIDLHTRAIFFEANVYNPMLDRVCHCRMIGEITSAGGLMPTFDFQVVRLWERVSSVDELYVGLTACVGCFYAYYLWELYKVFKIEGFKILHSFLSVCQIANVVFFFAAVGCMVQAERGYPSEMDPNSDEYFDLGPSVRFKGWALCIQGINVFLNWFKLISILGYSKTFALVNETIQKAAGGVAGFLMAFFVIFYGFSQTHCMLFQGRLQEFSTIGDSCFTLMRSLLGDFDFERLQHANLYLGPILFIIFVVLAVFVILNMLIAIISDAYVEVEEDVRNRPHVDLFEDIKDFLMIQLVHGDMKRPLELLRMVIPHTVGRWVDAEEPSEKIARKPTVTPLNDIGDGAADGAAGDAAGAGSPTKVKMNGMVRANTASNLLMSKVKKKPVVPPTKGGDGTGGSLSNEQISQLAAKINSSLESKFGSIDNKMRKINAEQGEVRKVVAHLIREVHQTLSVLKPQQAPAPRMIAAPSADLHVPDKEAEAPVGAWK